MDRKNRNSLRENKAGRCAQLQAHGLARHVGFMAQVSPYARLRNHIRIVIGQSHSDVIGQSHSDSGGVLTERRVHISLLADRVARASMSACKHLSFSLVVLRRVEGSITSSAGNKTIIIGNVSGCWDKILSFRCERHPAFPTPSFVSTAVRVFCHVHWHVCPVQLTRSHGNTDALRTCT